MAKSRLNTGRSPARPISSETTNESGSGEEATAPAGSASEPYIEGAARSWKYPPETVAQAVALRDLGVPFADISAQLGVPETTLVYWLNPESAIHQRAVANAWRKANPERLRAARQRHTQRHRKHINKVRSARVKKARHLLAAVEKGQAEVQWLDPEARANWEALP